MSGMQGTIAERLRAIAAATLVVVGASCAAPESVDTAAEESHEVLSADGLTPPRPGIASSSTTVGPSTMTALAPTTEAAIGDAAARLARIVVAPERGADFYNRDDWPHWSTQPDGCSTRERVLIDESRGVPQVDPFGCKVLAGEWLSTYDGEVTEDPTDLEVDHLVALAEAHRSGGWTWDEDRRRAYANDLGHAGALNAVTEAVNRSKGDKDPARWQPPRDAAWCDYATAWIEVKVRWGLTADEAEVRALGNMLRSCT